MQIEQDRQLVDVYASTIASFAFGMLRFWNAEAASARLAMALLEFHTTPKSELSENPYQRALENLAKVPRGSYEALSYVTDVSHLVYATTLLDTFLTDTTVFLLLRFPRSIGSARQIPLESVLGASSIQQVLTEAAIRKSREVSFLSFEARVEFLRHTFGLPIELPADVHIALAHYPSIRNAAVHDQGVFEFSLNEKGEVTCRQKTCPHHPIPVSGDDVSKAAHCYIVVATAVARAVFGHVLKCENHAALAALVRAQGGPTA